MTCPIRSYERDAALGRAGVHEAIRRIERDPRVIAVRDLDEDLAAQRAGYDLEVMLEGQPEPARVEVKSDTHRPENMALEVVSNTTTGRPGCVLTSHADYWAYVYVHHGLMFFSKLEPLRAWLRRSRHELREVGARTRAGGGSYETRSVLAPVRRLRVEVEGSALLDLASS